MQESNSDFNGSLSDTDRYDITINSLVKIKEEMDKTENNTVFDICNHTIVQILRDSYRHGDELQDVKKRIEQLMSETKDDTQKQILSSINKKIKMFYLKQNPKGLSQ